MSALDPVILKNVLETVIISGKWEITDKKGGLGGFTSSSSINSRRSLGLLFARSSLLGRLGLGHCGLFGIIHGLRSFLVLHRSVCRSTHSIAILLLNKSKFVF
jgi:hypothetical protein